MKIVKGLGNYLGETEMTEAYFERYYNFERFFVSLKSCTAREVEV